MNGPRQHVYYSNTFLYLMIVLYIHDYLYIIYIKFNVLFNLTI